jgi:uncharacterized protein with gpF-like domain
MPARKVRVIKKREEWVRRFKIPLVKGTPLHVAETIGTRYGDRLVRLIDRMTAQCKREVLASLRENLPDDMVGDASPANQVQIVFNGLRKKWEEAFGRIAKPTVDIWAEQVSKDSEKKLATSIKELSGDLTLDTSILTGPLHDMLDATVKENVSLIKQRVCQDYLNNIQGDVMRSIQSGNGLQDLIPALEKRGVQVRNWAKNVAMDQTRKAFNGLNRGRMQALGMDEFEWIHGGGSNHPREYHRDVLHGKIFSFDPEAENYLPHLDGPNKGERGIPGQAVYCRCTMRPVFRLPAGYHE